ncbi:uncharacterized protein B0H64DRAFT_331941 [Chaetomium fimeti]|uniref:ubiquitinyl hydrolase 1 n=1 Tax=Chaetomium fimeti TaxID=1854472 RepID=A0AAE0H6A2_9PEZI|nr:hypothetical protein B0H64DRAFT_331941 [Chaetomium fimeti]
MSIDQVTAQIEGLALEQSPTLADSPSPVEQVAQPRAAGKGEDLVRAVPHHPGTHAVGPGGRLASRLIQDWFAGYLPEGGEGGLQTKCSALRVFPPHPDGGSDHDFIIEFSQSYDAPSDPEGRGRTLISCMCSHCRHHFVFHICPPSGEESEAHLQHHFRVEHAESHAGSESAVFQPYSNDHLRGRFRYACTLCGLAVNLEISVPRLKPSWLKMVMDENRIKESLRIAREQDPARYANLSPEKETHYLTTALSTLNQYLKNILDDDGTGAHKRISCRNKTFLVQFGRDCDHIFRYLGFKEDHSDESGESYWLPPRLPPPEGKAPVGSLRAFYDDVRYEVQSVLADRPPVPGEPVIKPISAAGARDQLEKALGCDKSHRCFSTLPVNENESQYFTALGAPVDADDALIKFAYGRQVESDPENTPAYLEALGTLAARRSEELQMFVFTHQELLAKRQREATAVAPDGGQAGKAYAHFGLTRASSDDPAYIVRVYRTYREQSPAQKSDHRLALLEIWKDCRSDEIRIEVFRKNMDLSEACKFLHVEPEWPMDNIAASAQSVSSDLDLDHLDLLILALESISTAKPENDPNRSAFERAFTEIVSGRESLVLLSDNSGFDGPGRAAAERSREAVDLELPVGLANLRNTCYLNSILQYFYSVNAVRNLAVGSDLPALEPTEANLSHILRAGSSNQEESRSELETGRAFVGHEFTRELGTLFRHLDAAGDSSIPPRQRLANAALLRPEKLRPHDGDAPPLPPRAVESSVREVSDVPMLEVEPSDLESSASSQQTLVDCADPENPLIVTLDDRITDKETATVDSPAKPVPSDPTVTRSTEGEVKMSKLTVEELATELDKPNVGSDQMDVDEVMGNAIDHLRAAFKVSSISGSETAPDPIKDAFFSTFIDNRKKIDESKWNRTSRSDRWVTAYPAQSGTRDLYDALANSFDLEPLPGDLLSFTTIERPAPHFHVCIQRSDGVRKNANPISIPETLYLDRFMDTSDTQSSLHKGRKRKWDIDTRLNEMTDSTAKERLDTSKPGFQAAGRPSDPSPQADGPTEEEVDGFLLVGGSDELVQAQASSVAKTTDINLDVHGSPDAELKQLMGKYGVKEPDVSRTSPRPLQKSTYDIDFPPVGVTGFWEKFVAEEKAERERLMAERDGIFGDARAMAYRLHAVVCHAGTTASAGHYWVWIHDFERNVWRKYNDTVVSVHPAEFVFGELNTKGEPYYLAYVRADQVPGLVSIPRRKPLAPPPVPPRPTSAEDTLMTDDGDNVLASIEHW